MAFRRVVFALTRQTKAQARNIPRTKFPKDKGKEEAHLQSGITPSETLEEGYNHAWESDDWSSSQWPDDSWTGAAGWYGARAHAACMAVQSCVPSDTRGSGSGLHTIDWIEISNRQISARCIVFMALQRKSAAATNLSCLPTQK